MEVRLDWKLSIGELRVDGEMSIRSLMPGDDLIGWMKQYRVQAAQLRA